MVFRGCIFVLWVSDDRESPSSMPFCLLPALGAEKDAIYQLLAGWQGCYSFGALGCSDVLDIHVGLLFPSVILACPCSLLQYAHMGLQSRRV